MSSMRRTVMIVVALDFAAAAIAGVYFGTTRSRGAPSVRAATATATAIDRAKTLRYLEGWARRDRWDSFPESPSFAFYNVYATRALGGDVSPEVRARVVDYLRRCQSTDGGFTSAPATGASHVVPTLYALRTLALVGSLGAIDRSRAASFLASLARADGGYTGRADEAEATLGTTFHALAALDVLGEVRRVDLARTARYLSSHRATDGGFALRPGMTASPAGTFMAVRSLKLLGALDAGTSEAVARHLAGSRYSGRIREGKFAGAPEVEEEEKVLAALADVGRLNVVDREEVERFVTSLYVGENGGFGPQPGLGTTPPSTYQAIACLVALGRLPEPPRG